MNVKYAFISIALLFLVGCNDNDNDSAQTMADEVREQLMISEADTASSVFISSLNLEVPTENISAVEFSIAPKDGSFSEAISAQYKISSLNYNDASLMLPIWGMYENFDNSIEVTLYFQDDSKISDTVILTAPPYVDSNEIFDRIIKNESPTNEGISFSYFYLENNTDQGPVIVDIDGNVRWTFNPEMLSEPGHYRAAYFTSGGFKVQNGNKLITLNLDGTISEVLISADGLSDIVPHHETTVGKRGYLLNINTTKSGVNIVEAIVIEVDGNGQLIQEWDFGEIISNYMLENGDDPSTFVIDGVDWFHMNSAIYDPSDDSIIASSRENFVIKVDYETKKIIWILGDETKYWATFPSLLTLSLSSNDIKPMGEHALSLVNGELMLFNNGQASFNQPDGAPVGETLSSSLGMKWAIDMGNMTATNTWTYDSGLYSDICSSIYEKEGDHLVTYSSVDRRDPSLSRAIFRGIDASQNVLFEFEHSNKGGACVTWNSDILNLSNLNF
ncbi:aryl-sulfate sulfotransferase [Vibrio breoganii]|uniref:aryl-sulfate sulfotransferase n=1 Tax=Vibrio breoganii TaxID=553239 RepID=UPI0021C3B0C1|nr:aryl-sulfate sulfotransferase [Vibrio breoganii]MDN3714484.1 aryl-sulfate sulfotransferase [Vibrio breoganii]